MIARCWDMCSGRGYLGSLGLGRAGVEFALGVIEGPDRCDAGTIYVGMDIL